MIGRNSFAESIALIDVTNPDEGKVKEVLWTKQSELDVNPSYPLFSASTRQCIFVGEKRKQMALYSVRQGQSGPPKRLEARGYDNTISDLAGSPGGQYVIFCSDRHR